MNHVVIPSSDALLSFEQNDLLLFLFVCRMNSQFAIEIVLLDIQRLAVGPLINAHLLYQAKIENLGVVRPNGCLIRIRVKMVAGKVCTLITVCDALLARAAEYIARLDVTQK